MTHPKDTPATSGSADQEVIDEAVAAIHFRLICAGDKPDTDTKRKLVTLIKTAEQAAELQKENMRLNTHLDSYTDTVLNERKCAELYIQELRQRVTVLEGVLKECKGYCNNAGKIISLVNEALNQSRSGEKI